MFTAAHAGRTAEVAKPRSRVELRAVSMHTRPRERCAWSHFRTELLTERDTAPGWWSGSSCHCAVEPASQVADAQRAITDAHSLSYGE